MSLKGHTKALRKVFQEKIRVFVWHSRSAHEQVLIIIEGIASKENEMHSYLVAADASGLEGLGGELLILVGHQVDAQGELVHAGLLPAQVEDADLGVGDAAAEAGLGVGLVLAVAVAAGGTATNLEGSKKRE